jgi:hypothetical protein
MAFFNSGPERPYHWMSRDRRESGEDKRELAELTIPCEELGGQLNSEWSKMRVERLLGRLNGFCGCETNGKEVK